MNFRNRYSPSQVVGLTFSKPSMTEQSHKLSCDINTLVNRFQSTGVLGDPSQYREMFYGDFTNVGDYRDQQQRLAEIRQSFEALPSETREAFGNDVGRLIEAFNDPSKVDLLVKHKLLRAAEPAATPLNPVDTTLSPEQKSELDKQSAQLPTRL